jgi:hypothetical protein
MTAKDVSRAELSDKPDIFADQLITLRPERARWEARNYIVDFLRYLASHRKGHRKIPFTRVCEHFVTVLLPLFASDPDGSAWNRILRFAGYGDVSNAEITVAMLRAWDREANVPPTEEVDTAKSWFTPLELTALSREGILPGLPTTSNRMERNLQNTASAAVNPAAVRRRAR